MVLVILLIVVLALILISLYAEVRINKLVNDELDNIEDTIDSIDNDNRRIEARVRALELIVDELKESLNKEE